MGRSVSTHQHSVATVYLHPEFEGGDDYAFQDFIDDLKDNVLCPKYPSLCACDRWSGREDHVVLENSQVEISISEYCGLVAVCLAPLDPGNAFQLAVAERMSKSFHKTLHRMFKSCALESIGRMSNGEQVFQQAI